MADVNTEAVHESGDDGFTMRKRLAMGKALPSGDFGVASMSSHCAGGVDTQDSHLADHQRGARPPVGHNQANPDHGEFK